MTTPPLELIFVRHGEGEHLLDLPRSLALKHPRLTEAGRLQVEAVQASLGVTERDLVLASPTPRTLETARILCGPAPARKLGCPVVGPRMFPQDPRYQPLICDEPLAPAELSQQFPEFDLHPADTDDQLWSGINQIPHERFARAALDLIAWCAQARPARVIVVAHDGTIHNYRQLLGETGLTRASFLGPAGVHRVLVPPPAHT